MGFGCTPVSTQRRITGKKTFNVLLADSLAIPGSSLAEMLIKMRHAR
jgi:hypothetical protein